MRTAPLALPLGIACLVLAARLAPPPAGDPSGTVRAPGEGAIGAAASGVDPAARPVPSPVAEALRPLGPVRAVAASLLWALVRDAQHAGDAATVADLSEALLALHPDLDEVRIFLARQLVVTWAPRRADPERHEALVARGLALLEEGFDAGPDDARLHGHAVKERGPSARLHGNAVKERGPSARLHGNDVKERGPSARLHGALGTLLALQPAVDPRFAPVAARWFGERPEDVAIQELRRGRPGSGDSVNLILLLVDRGLTTLARDGELYDAERDLAEAETVLDEFTAEERSLLAPELEPLRRVVEEARVPTEGARS